MRIIESIEEMREYSQQCKRDGKTIASVATDSYLHDGHMSCVKIAKENADVVMLSAFHNFNYFFYTPEKYTEYITKYQTDFLEADLIICKENDVDVFFQPSMLDLYSNLTNKITLSGPLIDRFIKKRASMPHFANRYGDAMSLDALGNLQIFNIQSPDVKIIGEKDIYELTSYVKFLIDDLNYSIKLIVAPTIRDSDGLALSSRNRFLSDFERQKATSIYQILHEISKWSVYPPVAEIKEHITNRIESFRGTITYIDICCVETLEELDSIDRKCVIIISAMFSDMDYLVDQIIIEP